VRQQEEEGEREQPAQQQRSSVSTGELDDTEAYIASFLGNKY